MTSIFALQAYTQNYGWVKLGSTSKAAAYATPGFEADEETPYAGAISFGGALLFTLLVSSVLPTDASHTFVDGRIRRCPRSSCRAAGRPTEDPRVGLPAFLFKLLAIHTALSIQSYPDKKFAERLDAVAPNLYKCAPSPRITTTFLFCCPHRQMNKPESQTRNVHRVDTVPRHGRLQRAE
jgi:mannose-6-phosphate isomerase